MSSEKKSGGSAGELARYVHAGGVQKQLHKLLGTRAPQFVMSLVAAANGNKQLAACDPQSVVSAALIAASINLPINSNLGFAYLVPYKVDGAMTCQFQMGYRGFIQLALRTGKYRNINASDVREGELKNIDLLTGEVELSAVENRDTKPVIGYVAHFELTNGFKKSWYMTKAELTSHAEKYSQNYRKWKSGLWAENFDAMAKKTVLKLLLSKYGDLSAEMETALDKDQTIDGEYRDNPSPEAEAREEALQKLESANDMKELAKAWSELEKSQQADPEVKARKDQLKEDFNASPEA